MSYKKIIYDSLVKEVNFLEDGFKIYFSFGKKGSKMFILLCSLS